MKPHLFDQTAQFIPYMKKKNKWKNYIESIQLSFTIIPLPYMPSNGKAKIYGKSLHIYIFFCWYTSSHVYHKHFFYFLIILHSTILDYANVYIYICIVRKLSFLFIFFLKYIYITLHFLFFFMFKKTTFIYFESFLSLLLYIKKNDKCVCVVDADYNIFINVLSMPCGGGDDSTKVAIFFLTI